jgi:hypothetical protein
MAEADHAEVVPPCDTLARQYIRVVGWRSTVGVKLVWPPVPSATPAWVTTANNPEMVDAVVAEKSDRSEIWNSYTRVPVRFADAFCTVNVGRSVDNCASFTGETTVGAPSVRVGVGAGGVVGVLELQLDNTTRALSDTARKRRAVGFVTPELFGWKVTPVNLSGKKCHARPTPLQSRPSPAWSSSQVWSGIPRRDPDTPRGHDPSSRTE